jgi:hypothetical protein
MVQGDHVIKIGVRLKAKGIRQKEKGIGDG